MRLIIIAWFCGLMTLPVGLLLLGMLFSWLDDRQRAALLASDKERNEAMRTKGRNEATLR